MKNVLLALTVFVAVKSQAIECTFNVTDEKSKESVSKPVVANEEVEIHGFKSSYIFDEINDLEVLTIASPEGGSISHAYTFNLLPMMKLTYVSEGNATAILSCAR